MRHLLLSLGLLLLPAAPALAQVTVDLRALDALPHLPGSPPHRFVARTPAVQPPGQAVTRPAGTAAVATAQPSAAQPSTAHPSTPPGAAEATTPAGMPAPAALATGPMPAAGAPTPAAGPTPPAAPTQPALPPATFAAAPPPVAVIPPVQPPVPPASASPPAPPPITANAATTAAATPAGLRLTFNKGQSDLSPESADSIKQLVQTAPHTDTVSYNVLAYASGDPDDPSVARRLSLARAIAVRSALMADGVPSARIYLRALGSQPGGGGPPDRVAIDVLGGNTTAVQR